MLGEQLRRRVLFPDGSLVNARLASPLSTVAEWSDMVGEMGNRRLTSESGPASESRRCAAEVEHPRVVHVLPGLGATRFRSDKR